MNNFPSCSLRSAMTENVSRVHIDQMAQKTVSINSSKTRNIGNSLTTSTTLTSYYTHQRSSQQQLHKLKQTLLQGTMFQQKNTGKGDMATVRSSRLDTKSKRVLVQNSFNTMTDCTAVRFGCSEIDRIHYQRSRNYPMKSQLSQKQQSLTYQKTSASTVSKKMMKNIDRQMNELSKSIKALDKVLNYAEQMKDMRNNNSQQRSMKCLLPYSGKL